MFQECTLDEAIDTSDADSLNSKDGVADDKSARVMRSGSFDNDKGGSPQKSQNQYQRYVQQKQISQQYQHGHRSIPKHLIPPCTPVTSPMPSQLQQQTNPNSRFPVTQHGTYSRSEILLYSFGFRDYGRLFLFSELAFPSAFQR